jgi:2-succinyl-6-hydroxy-2,4-cyclohexadiene-1-carboxylate synthase
MTPLHLALLASGRPGTTPLVLLHGFTGDATTWADLLPHLDAGRTVWAVDLVGHGRSPAPEGLAEYTMAAVVASVAAAVRGAGVERAHWLGYSMGGRVALHLALAEPGLVASLALVGASPGIPDPVARAARVAEDEALAAFIEQEGLAAFVDRWSGHPLFATQAALGPEHLARMRAQRLRNRPEALARVLRGMGTGAMGPVVDRLSEIRAPVLIVAGALDDKFTRLAQLLAGRLQASDLWIAPNVGHAVQVEAPAALAVAWEAFLRRAEGG